MVWIRDKPRLDKAWYWWRPEGGTNEDAKCVFVDFQSSDFQMAKGEWSHRPISFPDERCLLEVANSGPQLDPKLMGCKQEESMSKPRHGIIVRFLPDGLRCIAYTHDDFLWHFHVITKSGRRDKRYNGWTGILPVEYKIEKRLGEEDKVWRIFSHA